MPVFGDAGNPDAYYGFTTQTFENTGDPIVVDVESETFSSSVGDFSSYAALWTASISIEEIDPAVLKFYGGGVGRANYGFVIVSNRAVRYPLTYIEVTNLRVPPHKLWWYNPAFYSGNRYVPSEATYGALLSGDFPLDLGINTKPNAAFSSAERPGDALRISLNAGVLSIGVQVNYYIWGTTLFPGATSPVTFIEI
jgi:hypothetical protein